MAEIEEDLKSLLMKVKEESEKVDLSSAFRKLRSWHPSHHFMAIYGETMETVADFVFLAPKSLEMVTAAMKLKDACSLEEKL